MCVAVCLVCVVTSLYAVVCGCVCVLGISTCVCVVTSLYVVVCVYACVLGVSTCMCVVTSLYVVVCVCVRCIYMYLCGYSISKVNC